VLRLQVPVSKAQNLKATGITDDPEIQLAPFPVSGRNFEKAPNQLVFRRFDRPCGSSGAGAGVYDVQPAPSRDATPNIAIHLQVELLRDAGGIGNQKHRRHVADLADVARAPVMQNDLPDLRSFVSRDKPSFANS
jgi:hypothetical protein